MSISKRGGRKAGAGRPKGTTRGQGLAKLITFPPDIWAAVEELAKLEAVRPADLVRQVVKKYLEQKR